MDSATYDRIAALVNNFSGRRITVLGDLMLDRYIKGSVRRISPEAPVPIVKVAEEFTVCGGAGNVAVNLAKLGAKTSIISVTGKDGAAKKLSREKIKPEPREKIAGIFSHEREFWLKVFGYK